MQYPSRKLLTITEVCELLGISRPTYYRRVEDGTLPKPIDSGSGPRHVEGEVLEWIDQKIAERDASAFA